MESGVQSVFIMDIRFLALVAIAGCSIAKRGQVFSLLRIPNFIICRIEGAGDVYSFCFVTILTTIELISNVRVCKE